MAVTYGILQKMEDGTHTISDVSEANGKTEQVETGLIFVDVLFSDSDTGKEYRQGFAAAVDADGNYDEEATFVLCDAIVENINSGEIKLEN